MTTSHSWIERFPALSALGDEVAGRLGEMSQIVELPAKTTVFHPGDEPQNFLLVLDGVVRVQMTSETGREIVLYRVDPGETCILTTTCLLGHSAYNAEGITESPVTAVAIPAKHFHEIIGLSPMLRDFVFQSYGERLTHLLSLVEEVVFARLEVRVARLLLERSDAHGVLTLTHQQLAVELGTAREVISRQLKEFERQGLVNLKRGSVELADVDALGRLASS
ncbi:Crp/Fnr family transcriptional regulator [Magnetovibrio sp. PR-2]|uniref:Crp/Fnr family transcriptional regulator n=1 Tax=Magnetovibrio sp. PR-2 TaxID=3120356 RepID=UPI002FCE22A2